VGAAVGDAVGAGDCAGDGDARGASFGAPPLGGPGGASEGLGDPDSLGVGEALGLREGTVPRGPLVLQLWVGVGVGSPVHLGWPPAAE